MNQKLVMIYSKVVGGGSVEAETTGVLSKLGKDVVKSFLRQGGSLEFGFSLLAMIYDWKAK